MSSLKTLILDTFAFLQLRSQTVDKLPIIMACFLDPTYPHCVHQARRQTRCEQLSLSAIFNVMSSGKRRNIETHKNATLLYPALYVLVTNMYSAFKSISAELWSIS